MVSDCVGEKGKANFKRCWFSVKIDNSSKEHIQGDTQFVFDLRALWHSLLLQNQMFLLHCTNSCYTVFEWTAVLVILGHNNSTAAENTGYRMRKTKTRFHPCFNIILWSFSQLCWGRHIAEHCVKIKIMWIREKSISISFFSAILF